MRGWMNAGMAASPNRVRISCSSRNGNWAQSGCFVGSFVFPAWISFCQAFHWRDPGSTTKWPEDQAWWAVTKGLVKEWPTHVCPNTVVRVVFRASERIDANEVGSAPDVHEYRMILASCLQTETIAEARSATSDRDVL